MSGQPSFPFKIICCQICKTMPIRIKLFLLPNNPEQHPFPVKTDLIINSSLLFQNVICSFIVQLFSWDFEEIKHNQIRGIYVHFAQRKYVDSAFTQRIETCVQEGPLSFNIVNRTPMNKKCSQKIRKVKNSQKEPHLERPKPVLDLMRLAHMSLEPIGIIFLVSDAEI